MKRLMIAKNSVRKIQNLLVNHKSQLVTSNTVWVSFSSLSARPTDITASNDITSFNVTGSTIPPITDQEVLRLIMMMRIVNWFCGMVHKRKTLHLISSWDHCQRSLPSRITDTPRTGFESTQNLSSGLAEFSSASSVFRYFHNIWMRESLQSYFCSIYSS